MPLSTDQRELAIISLDSANSLLALINEILDFSKIDARKLHLEKIDFDLNQMLETAIHTLRAKAEKKKLTLVSFVAGDVPARVKGDPGRGSTFWFMVPMEKGADRVTALFKK